MADWTKTTNSEPETIAAAAQFMGSLQLKLANTCLILLLRGDLGVGKTQFTKGVAQFLQVEADVTSPSYVYVSEYSGKKVQMIHVDLWRIESEQDFLALHLEKYLHAGVVIVVEWPQVFVTKGWIEQSAAGAHAVYDVVIKDKQADQRELTAIKL